MTYAFCNRSSAMSSHPEMANCESSVLESPKYSNYRWASSLSSGYNSTGPTGGRSRPTAESTRKEMLASDPFIAPSSVLPRSVQCNACKKLIRLGSKTTYALANWHRHRDLTCSDVGRLRAQGMGSQEPHVSIIYLVFKYEYIPLIFINSFPK